ncbi:hypothetical protein LN42_03315 [Marinitoga sp. 1137]|uniref:DUF996 domain-containing protein n=1 Tax=Marinitoga sp. 1137 TaxID=1545835 RepID=UPI0009506195|nr:DUF996 domain-containing protein [Marinitoga sp. 1137]APT75529.1 hypothetical protein LN42_03315 [Marinitoga sp. 1137]
MNNELKTAKILAGVGAILSFAGHFGIIGAILELVGVYKISQVVRDKRIFNYLLWPTIFIYAIYAFGFLGILKDFHDTVTGINYYNVETNFFFSSSFRVLLLFIALMIIPVIYKIKAYNLLGDYFGNDYFYKAATFTKWGLILFVILIGFVLYFIASIFVIIGYFSLPDEYYQPEKNTEFN